MSEAVDIERRYNELVAAAQYALKTSRLNELDVVLQRHDAEPLPDLEPSPAASEALRELRVILQDRLASPLMLSRASELLVEVQREFDAYNRLRRRWERTAERAATGDLFEQWKRPGR